MALTITKGKGLRQPKGKRVAVNGETPAVDGVVSALEEMSTGTEVWWSPNAWKGDKRGSALWASASGVAVDIDWHGHGDPPLSLLVDLATAKKLPGNAFHLTPNGARVVFVFPEDVFSSEEFRKAARGGGDAVASILPPGFVVDRPTLEDLGRLFFAPKAHAKGVQRNASVLRMRQEPYQPSELFPPEPLPEAPAGYRPSVDLDDAVDTWNSQHRETWPKSAGICPVCDHRDCFGTLPDDDERWFCWSTGHPDGIGVKSARGYHGDALDMEAWRSGLSRVAVLRRDGHIPPRAARPPSGGARETNGAHEEGTAEEQLPILQASSIPIVKVEWLWKGRIPRGMISILDGDPGLCKSTVIASLAAIGSRGEPLPGESRETNPWGTVLISYEDHPGAIIVPRLMAAGADLEKVHIWDLGKQHFDLLSGVGLLEKVIRRVTAGLVVIDPFMAAMPSELSAHKDQDVRSILAPLSVLAERTNCAILFVRHLNKNNSGSAVYRGGGSIGIIGAARCGMLLGRDNDEAEEGDTIEDNGRRVLAVTKCNVGKHAPALKLQVVSADPPAPGIEVARIEWGIQTSTTADDLIEPRGTQRQDGQKAKCIKEITKLLEDGSRYAKEIIEELREHGYSTATIDRAKKIAKVQSVREFTNDKTSKWIWSI